MTPKEQLLEVLNKSNVYYQEEPVTAWVEKRQSEAGSLISIPAFSPKEDSLNSGYSGFENWIYFDADGKILEWAIVE